MKSIEDEVLIMRARADEEDCLNELINRYKPLVSSIARAYFLVGGDTDDLIQEGMIGLYSALLQYDAGEQASFKTFATLCIRRRVQSAIKGALRLKNQPLNNSLALNNQGMLVVSKPAEEDGEDEEGIYVVSNDLTPEEELLNKEQFESTAAEIKSVLSEAEYKVLVYYIKGMSYAGIAERTGFSLKAIDNALSRIKGKLAHLV